MQICDLLAYSQAYAGAGVFILGVEALEDQEYLILKLVFDTYTVVRDDDLPVVIIFCTCYSDMRDSVLGHELHSVVYEVLEHLGELVLLCKYRGQVDVLDDSPFGLDGALQILSDYE